MQTMRLSVTKMTKTMKTSDIFSFDAGDAGLLLVMILVEECG